VNRVSGGGASPWPAATADALLAMQPLDALDGVALVVQQAAHAAQDGDILRPIEPPAARPLHRPDEGEFGFPEPQYVLRHAQLVGCFRDRPKGFGALRHGG
jgi:hypothetical protein